MTDLALKAFMDFVAEHKSQSEAARKLGYTPGFVSNVKNGVRPVPEAIYDKIGVVKTIERVKP